MSNQTTDNLNQLMDLPVMPKKLYFYHIGHVGEVKRRYRLCPHVFRCWKQKNSVNFPSH